MIKGITPKLAEAGKIKIGGLGPERPKERGGTYRMPQKYDHFLITTTNRTPAGDLEIDNALMAELEADTDGEVRAIPIVLHSDEIDEVFPTAYALYSGRRCACRGDGETALKRELTKGDKKQYTGASKSVPCPCEYLKAATGPVCKPNGKLFCSIAVTGAAIAGAVHVWRTTSIISIEQMIGSLLQIRSICGTLRNVPLWLRVRPITVEPPGVKGAITVYCCHVELRAADIAVIQRNALDAAKLRRELGSDGREYREMLTLPAHDETTDEQSDIAQEFYPEDRSNAGIGPELPAAAPMDALTDRLEKQAAANGKTKAAPAKPSSTNAKPKPKKSAKPKPAPPPPENEDADSVDPKQELSDMAADLWGKNSAKTLAAACDEAGIDIDKMTPAEAGQMIDVLIAIKDAQ